jgi:hypothetical protein
MAKMSFAKKRVLPEAFREHRRAEFERTIQLTQKAITKLQVQSQTVTLVALSEATRTFDEKGKGLSPNTILRNPKAAELFRQHSRAYQARQQKIRNVKRKRPRVSSEVQAAYRGLRSADLVQMIETLKAQIAELKTQQTQLQTERDGAYRLRDQALQLNARQLGALTKSTTQVQLTGKTHEP